MRHVLRVVLSVLAISAACLGTLAVAQTVSRLPEPFVYLADIAPDIQQDMRYASGNNFLGRRVDGYLEPKCILTRDTALALKRVQQALALKRRNFSLKVYDCYRPVRAVGDFLTWS